LGSNQATFGPAQDGGYWLIGLKRIKPVSSQIFNSVRWSSKTALKDTVASMPGLKVSYVSTLSDVDHISDL
jgi:uncharacterized protein